MLAGNERTWKGRVLEKLTHQEKLSCFIKLTYWVQAAGQKSQLCHFLQFGLPREIAYEINCKHSCCLFQISNYTI